MENLCHSSSLGEFHEIRDKETMNSGLQVQKTLQKWKEAELQEITVSEYIAFLQWPGTNFPQKYLKGKIISSFMWLWLPLPVVRHFTPWHTGKRQHWLPNFSSAVAKNSGDSADFATEAFIYRQKGEICRMLVKDVSVDFFSYND